MIKITGYDKPMQVLYMDEGGPDGSYHLRPICPRCKNALCGDERRCQFYNQKFIWKHKKEKTMINYKKFVNSKFHELSKLFNKKFDQYAGFADDVESTDTVILADALANFRAGALLKYGDASYQHMYACAKDYARKHIAFIETHNIEADNIEESLGDIAVYAVIMMYMKACYEEKSKMKIEQLTAEAK